MSNQHVSTSNIPMQREDTMVRQLSREPHTHSGGAVSNVAGEEVVKSVTEVKSARECSHGTSCS